MLPDRALDLLTAYVDGEISSRQRKHVMRLLEKSSEARRLLKDLQQDAQRLKQLPARKLEPTFANHVLAVLQHRAVVARAPQIMRRRTPVWTRYAVAASVLVILGSIVWLATRQPHAPDKPGPIVQTPTPEPKSNGRHDPLVARVVEGVFGGFGASVPPDRAGTTLAFEELAKTQWHEHLIVDMAKQKAVQLDVAVSNQRQAVQRLETVLQNKGIRVLVDTPASARLQGSAPPRTEFVIYAENIRPDELAAMLYELGTDERARTSIETLTVSNVSDDDQRLLGKLLGVGAEDLREPPAQRQPLNTFIPKDSQATTKSPVSSVRTPSVSEPRVAMVLANVAQSGKLSSQVQSFLNQRRQLQPGALQVIVVVHQA